MRSHRSLPVRGAAAIFTPVAVFIAAGAPAQDSRPAEGTASSSLLVRPQAGAAAPSGSPAAPGAPEFEPHALRSLSQFAIAPAEARLYHEHDLIEIVVRETTSAKSTHALETEKETKLKGKVAQWPDLQLANLADGFFRAGSTDGLPAVDFQFKKEFTGDGDYERRDDFTARLSAEVIQILPNGNLILESRTRIKNDDEESVLKVTGVCRPEDVTPANTILSTQLHDLRIEKIHQGELKKANSKGILTKILDAIFAF